jgi:Raf kinase inhibitor-like YbhB/YbcL family protein
MNMQVTSSAFAEGQLIPEKYTCDGKDLSPPLQWTNAPPNIKSLALIVDDPDAPVGNWVHWVIYGIAADTTGLPESVDKSQYVLKGARQGLNDFRRLGYGGPCPPPGKAHRYFFKLYALDTEIDLKPGAKKKDLLAAMSSHVVGGGAIDGDVCKEVMGCCIVVRIASHGRDGDMTCVAQYTTRNMSPTLPEGSRSTLLAHRILP